MNRRTTSDEPTDTSEHDDESTVPDTVTEDVQDSDTSVDPRADVPPADEKPPHSPNRTGHVDTEHDLPREELDHTDAPGGPEDTGDDVDSRAEPADREGGEGTKGRWRRLSALAGRFRLPRTRRARIVLAIVLLLVGGAGTGGYVWWAAGQLPDDAAFRVGDRVVNADELSQVTDTWRALYGVQPPKDSGPLDRFRRDAAKAHAVSLILDKAVQERGIVIADKTARDTLSRFITQQFGEGAQARDQFVQALGNAGTSEQDVLDEVKKQLAMAQLFDAVTKDVAQVTDQDVRDAFASRKDELGTPERRQLNNIVIRTKEEADQVVADLRDGASFEALARQRSIDSATRDKGGDLGARTRRQLQPDYAQAAFATAAGEVFGPVQNQFGWNVGKVVEIMPPVAPEFEQVREQLKQQLQLEKSLQTWRDWLADRIRDADVQYSDDYRPADPDAPPSVRPGQPAMPQGEEPEAPR